MNLKHLITNKGLGWGLIIAFSLLYLGVGFVSTLHSITFFQLANSLGLAILLGLTYEVGQAAVLFSLLMTKNKDKFLPWFLMILLTSLQVTANVYSSFLYMAKSGSTDWVYWQKSILFGVQASSPEMYQIIIAWIAGALLPLVALGMTALIAENMKMLSEEYETTEPIKVGSVPDEEVDEIINNEVAKRIAQPEPEQTVDPEREAFDNYIRDQGVAGHEHGDMRGIPGTTGIVESPELFTPPTPFTGTQELRQTLKEIYDEVEPEEVQVESKKEQELLPNEQVKVPQKRERFVNPLLKKGKVETIKVKDLYKPSKGEEVLALLEKQEKAKDKGSIKQSDEDAPRTHESLLIPPDILNQYHPGGVEVIDAKAIKKRT